ncbi:ABC transporter substrate-binding protein [Roseiarcaceae bacterium H3SJ34-1]|uniref:ABC transporter substrate-binding protein n=1 Tax=Terripilifer ovatus TaxID=3032367 RepID=UPI003AB9AE2A|nr:ABC transporter substrate-binding protein [Roseiarcaceae bacterium H3SJ34-1]
MKRGLFAWAFAGLSAAAALPAFAQTPVSVGILSAVSDAPLFIADKRGYFRDEGLAVSMTVFRSGATMVAPLGAGQLDVGAGSASAGLYNAIARGINIKIVADKASSAPGYGATKLLVRKDLIDSGRFKTIKDLKGMKIGMNAPGVSNTSTLNSILTAAGLKYSDVETVNLNFPDHVAALANKSIDAACTVEPPATSAITAGTAVEIMRDDQADPHHQIAVIQFSEAFAARKDIADRFMRAYLRGSRYYNKALKDGRLAGETADDVIQILTEYTPVKNRDILRRMTPTGMDPNGTVNQKSLQKDLDFYASQGLIEGKIDLDKIVDNSFAERAAKALGPYK